MSCPHLIAIFFSCILVSVPVYAKSLAPPTPHSAKTVKCYFSRCCRHGGTPDHRDSVLQADGKIVELLRYGGAVPVMLARVESGWKPGNVI
jgi:hypothetical protein